MGEGDTAIRLVKATSQLLRKSIAVGNDTITIDEELELLEKYLFVQKIHCKGRISIKLDVRKSYMDDEMRIPPLIIQPLVENAIYHGIKNKEGWGKITVTGRTDGNIAILQVTDDGIGMPDEECKRLNRLLEDDDHYGDEQKKLSEEAKITSHDSTKGGSHFGLYSVARRIKLYFGREFGASIESRQNEGTTITIRVPKASEALTLLT